MLGRVLRDMRVRSGTTRDEAGDHIDGSPSKISRMELGRVAPKELDVRRLLTSYRVDPAERDAVIDLVRQLGEWQWWHDYPDLPGWFCSYLVFESVAQRIHTYEVRFIPGILQTPAYAEALMRTRYRNPEEVRRRVEVRMQRRRLLLKGRPPLLWAVIDEGALSERIGGPRIMREQIDFLIQMAKHPNVHIQVLDTGRGGYIGVGNSFSTLRLPLASLPDIVYLEQIETANFFSSREESEPYMDAFFSLTVAAGNIPGSKPTDVVEKLTQARDRFESA